VKARTRHDQQIESDESWFSRHVPMTYRSRPAMPGEPKGSTVLVRWTGAGNFERLFADDPSPPGRAFRGSVQALAALAWQALQEAGHPITGVHRS